MKLDWKVSDPFAKEANALCGAWDQLNASLNDWTLQMPRDQRLQVFSTAEELTVKMNALSTLEPTALSSAKGDAILRITTLFEKLMGVLDPQGSVLKTLLGQTGTTASDAANTVSPDAGE